MPFFAFHDPSVFLFLSWLFTSKLLLIFHTVFTVSLSPCCLLCTERQALQQSSAGNHSYSLQLLLLHGVLGANRGL